MTRIGTVFLRVADLERQTAFYEQIIGLSEIRQDGDTVYLGAGDRELLGLIQKSDGVRRRGHNGLYHFALLLPTRADLARALYHLARTQTRIQGASDHLVSEAIYLADPEGNGIEIYADRPESAWYRDGQFQMDTLPLDLDNLLGELDEAPPAAYQIAADTVMGHIHLHVNNLDEALRFYRDQLGMDVMFQMPSAAFLSYDGYHHHIGINTWAGTFQTAPDSLGLDHYRLVMDEAARSTGDDGRITDPTGNTAQAVQNE